MGGLAILGATGSIGASALRLVRGHPGLAEVRLLTAHARADELLALVEEFRPALAYLTGGAPDAGMVARAARAGCRLSGDHDDLHAALAGPDIACVLLAVSGAAGLGYGLAALEAGKRLAIANKEPLVIAGRLFHDAALRGGGEMLPVDSEHSAVFQCLDGRPHAEVRRIILTTSGGPFHQLPAEGFRSVRVEDALRHPTWSMGRKITVDSATMMNKALEVLEARWLFSMPLEAIDVTVHRQAIVHSMVEFVDGSVLAQLGEPDMQLPILYALSYPRRVRSNLPRLDFTARRELTFEPLNPFLARAISLARACGENDAAPIILNAANEVFVTEFLEGRTPFHGVHDLVRRAMDALAPSAGPVYGLEEVLDLDRRARETTARLLREGG